MKIRRNSLLDKALRGLIRGAARESERIALIVPVMPVGHCLPCVPVGSNGNKLGQRYDNFAFTVPCHDKYRDAAKLVVSEGDDGDVLAAL
ncbi:hypothetical protein FEP63_05614 [Burkholderia multivorans]|nr:hypothetical protein [Burkholderia multivorans]MDR8883506.1 hypothetical protein [Burkholderia multivorans]MDR8889922.1 hypothetical protein [Burkholderia multivorans]MDR8896257.1 hypothetical protein [Burkholderia multivorans]MDR8902038.1 hypothetical protein [Burkholderia multivorans]